MTAAVSLYMLLAVGTAASTQLRSLSEANFEFSLDLYQAGVSTENKIS